MLLSKLSVKFGYFTHNFSLTTCEIQTSPTALSVTFGSVSHCYLSHPRISQVEFIQWDFMSSLASLELSPVALALPTAHSVCALSVFLLFYPTWHILLFLRFVSFPTFQLPSTLKKNLAITKNLKEQRVVVLTYISGYNF